MMHLILSVVHSLFLFSGHLPLFNTVYYILDEFIFGQFEHLLEWYIPNLRSHKPSEDLEPTITALLLLIVLRAVRKCLSAVSIILGRGEFTPIHMVTIKFYVIYPLNGFCCFTFITKFKFLFQLVVIRDSRKYIQGIRCHALTTSIFTA